MQNRESIIISTEWEVIKLPPKEATAWVKNKKRFAQYF